MEQNSNSLRIIDEEEDQFDLDHSKGMDSNTTLLNIESADFRSNATVKKIKVDESEHSTITKNK